MGSVKAALSLERMTTPLHLQKTLLFVAFSGLFNQFNQAGDLWLGSRLHQLIKLILGQILF
jgi:hypothetical protein